MNEPNPYRPPLAGVVDVHAETDSPDNVVVWSASGRIGRLRYVAYNWAATMLFTLAAIATTPVRGATFVLWLGCIPVLVLATLTAVRRAHDMDWPAWTIALMILPLVPLVWTFKAGTPGTNRYGPPPPPNSTAVKVMGMWLPLLGLVLMVLAIAFVALVMGSLYNKGWQ